MKLIEKHLGQFGRYQGLFYAMVFLPGFISGCQTLIFSFTGAVPKHRCYLPQVDHAGDQRTSYSNEDVFESTPFYYPVSETEGGKIVYCQYCPNATTESNLIKMKSRNQTCGSKASVDCNRGHLYDRSQYKTSLAMKFNMVCEGHWKRDLAKSMFMVGKLTGSLVFGYLSDRFGRRPILLACSMAGLLTFNVLPVLPTFWLLCIFQVINGSVTYGAYITAFVYVMELIGGPYRTVCGVMVQAFYTIGYLFVGLVAYLVRDWTYIQWIVSGPAILLLPYYWIVPESIRWQVVHGKLDDAMTSCRKVAKLNNLNLNEKELYEDMVKESENAKHEQTVPVIQIFKYRNFAIHSLIIFFSW